jgi:hypothetical protein
MYLKTVPYSYIVKGSFGLQIIYSNFLIIMQKIPQEIGYLKEPKLL